MLTAEEARRVWRYDADSGFFFWLIRPKYDVEVGSRAGYFDGKYWRLCFKGQQMKASRVAWLMMTGEWPLAQIDHENLNKADDRFSNLRDATHQQNCCNRGLRKDNKLRVKGVSVGRNGKYIAQIMVRGRLRHLGRFDSLEEAKVAYDSAALVHHGEFART